jgi:hypothetical protein
VGALSFLHAIRFVIFCESECTKLEYIWLSFANFFPTNYVNLKLIQKAKLSIATSNIPSDRSPFPLGQRRICRRRRSFGLLP